jgi:hypothetical protein
MLSAWEHALVSLHRYLLACAIEEDIHNFVSLLLGGVGAGVKMFMVVVDVGAAHQFLHHLDILSVGFLRDRIGGLSGRELVLWFGFSFLPALPAREHRRGRS